MVTCSTGPPDREAEVGRVADGLDALAERVWAWGPTPPTHDELVATGDELRALAARLRTRASVAEESTSAAEDAEAGGRPPT